MPAYSDSLTDEELRAVVMFERVRFGGENLDEALVGCGLVIPEVPAEGEEPPTDGEEVPAGGEESTETTEASS
jgi:hypothetical protein